MIVAGLDISTRNLDFVLLDTDNPAECEHRRVKLADRDGEWWETARMMMDTIDDPAGNGPTGYGDTGRWLSTADIIGIERPYGPSRGSIASLHTILGAVLATLGQIPGHPTVLEVRPAEMRKALGLKGNVSKERMHDAIFEHVYAGVAYREDERLWDWSPDALDAWAVAYAAWRMCENAAEREA